MLPYKILSFAVDAVLRTSCRDCCRANCFPSPLCRSQVLDTSLQTSKIPFATPSTYNPKPTTSSTSLFPKPPSLPAHFCRIELNRTNPSLAPRAFAVSQNHPLVARGTKGCWWGWTQLNREPFSPRTQVFHIETTYRPAHCFYLWVLDRRLLSSSVTVSSFLPRLLRCRVDRCHRRIHLQPSCIHSSKYPLLSHRS